MNHPACGGSILNYRREIIPMKRILPSYIELPRGRVNIMMSSYQHRESHYKGKKTVPRPYYRFNGNSILGKTVFTLRRGPALFYDLFKPTALNFVDIHEYGDTSRLSTDLNLVFLQSWEISDIIDMIMHSYGDLKLLLSAVEFFVLKCLI